MYGNQGPSNLNMKCEIDIDIDNISLSKSVVPLFPVMNQIVGQPTPHNSSVFFSNEIKREEVLSHNFAEETPKFTDDVNIDNQIHPVADDNPQKPSRQDNSPIINQDNEDCKHTSQLITFAEIKNIMQDVNLDTQFNQDNFKHSFSVLEDDYLKSEGIPSHGDDEFNTYLKTFKHDDLLMLKRVVDKMTLISPDDKQKAMGTDKIGPISSLEFLVESSYNHEAAYKKMIVKKILSLDEMIFRWRKVGGDGNCYYRAVMFYYIEAIILNRNLPQLKNLILDMKTAFEDSKLLSKMDALGIKHDLTLKCLILIYYAMTVHSNQNSVDVSSNSKYLEDILRGYDIFLKCYNKCKHFDYGFIIYFRYRLFKYIKANEDKLYTQEFSVKIGNLLPAEYETQEGAFLFDEFYEKYLMRFFKDAEKIVIYMTPFVLETKLKILLFDFGDNSEKIKEFDFKKLNYPMQDDEGISKNNINIPLLYRGAHYDLIYQEEYFNKYTKYLSHYVNLFEQLTVITSKIQNEIFQMKKGKQMKTNFQVIERKPTSSSEDYKRPYSAVPTVDLYTDLNTGPTTYQRKATQQVIDIIKCFSCGKVLLEIKQNKYQLCNECIIKQTKSCINSKYFLFLQSSKVSLSAKKPLQEDIESVLKKIRIAVHSNGASVGIGEALELVSNSEKKKSFEVKEYLMHVKSTLCVLCEKTFNPKDSTLWFKIPCGCSFCGAICVKNYFKLLGHDNALTSPSENFICFCSTVYDVQDLRVLLYFCGTHNLIKQRDCILKIFHEKTKSMCMLCTIDVPGGQGKVKFVCEVKDPQAEKVLMINSFNHLICTECANENFNSKNRGIPSQFCCGICSAPHKVIGIRKTTSDLVQAKCTIL